MTTIATPTDEVRALAQNFAITTPRAADVARTQLLLALQVSMTHTGLYELPALGVIAGTTPEALAAVVPPRTLAATAIVLGELCTALGGIPTPCDAMLYTDAWRSVADHTYAPASALVAELLPRRMSDPATVGTAPVPLIIASVVPLPPSSVLAVTASEGRGRPRRSPFETAHDARKRVAATPGWVSVLLTTLPQTLRVPGADLAADDKAVQTMEAYALSVHLLRDTLSCVDPHMPVGDLVTWLERVSLSIAGSAAGPALSSFVQRATGGVT